MLAEAKKSLDLQKGLSLVHFAIEKLFTCALVELLQASTLEPQLWRAPIPHEENVALHGVQDGLLRALSWVLAAVRSARLQEESQLREILKPLKHELRAANEAMVGTLTDLAGYIQNPEVSERTRFQAP